MCARACALACARMFRKKKRERTRMNNIDEERDSLTLRPEIVFPVKQEM